MNIDLKYLLLAIVVFSASCGVDQRKTIKTQQYAIEGKKLYDMHCANCHQPNGSGLGTLIPPISSSFVSENSNLVVCAIKYGLTGPINVNDTLYNGKMPGLINLTPIEIAEIITYLNTNWGDKGELFPIDSVNSALKNCSSRNK